MNKDALLATLIGFGIGLLITGLLLLGPNLLKYFPAIKLPSFSLSQGASKKEPTPSPTPVAGLTIDSPLAEAIENDTSLLVSGTATPGATLIIAGDADETAVVAAVDGKYAGKISLLEGKNDIVVTSYLGSKQSAATITVYYTPETL